MAANKTHFTDAKVAEWLADAKASRGLFKDHKRVEFQDDKEPRLRARVSAGRCAWSALIWANGKLQRTGLKTSREYNVARVRKEVGAAALALDKGQDPNKERKQRTAATKRVQQTVRDMAEAYIAQRELDGKPLSYSSVYLYRDSLEATLGAYYDRPLAQLDADTLAQLMRERSRQRMVPNENGRKVKRGSEAEAMRAAVAITRLCNLNRISPDDNPVKHLPDTVFDREVLNRVARAKIGSKQAQALYAWLDDRAQQYDKRTHEAMQLRVMQIALATGMRPSNVRSLRWEWLDFSTGLMTVPKTKNGNEFFAPMPEVMMDMLKPLKPRGAKPTGLVFPSVGDANKPTPLQDHFLKQLPYHATPKDGRKILTALIGSTPGVAPIAMKLMMAHSADKRDVTLRNYLAATAKEDQLMVMQPAADAVSAFYAAKLGNRAVIKEMEALAVPRREAAKEHRNELNREYRRRKSAKRRAMKAA